MNAVIFVHLFAINDLQIRPVIVLVRPSRPTPTGERIRVKEKEDLLAERVSRKHLVRECGQVACLGAVYLALFRAMLQ